MKSLKSPGTIRGDYSMSVQENIVHTSDSLETAEVELARFFNKDEIHEYPRSIIQSLYAPDEYWRHQATRKINKA